MPKISDIQETPNPNAVKFILREPVTHGVARQFGSVDQAQQRYAGQIAVRSRQCSVRLLHGQHDHGRKGGSGRLGRVIADPGRAYPRRGIGGAGSSDAAAAVGGAIAAVTSDDPRLLRINEILDEKVRPALDG